MRPVEEVLLGEPLAPTLVIFVQQRAVVRKDVRGGLEDNEAAVEVVGAELILVFLLGGREAVVDSCGLSVWEDPYCVPRTWFCCGCKGVFRW